MELVDAQVHTYELSTPERPWDPDFGAAAGDLKEQVRAHAAATAVPRLGVVDAMDRVGVSGSILVATSHYGWDNSYSLATAALWPDRFRVVGRIDHTLADVSDRVEAWSHEPFGVGLRLLFLSDVHRDQLRAGHFDALLASAQLHRVPVCVFPPNYVAELAAVAQKYPELQIVVDHLGLSQPPLMTPDPDRFQRLPELIALAQYGNVAVKMTAAATLSQESYPYRDIWPALHQLIAVFGPERMMWGTDWTRTAGVVSIEEGVGYMTETDEITDEDKRLILGASARRIFGWPRTDDASTANR